ncbi:MAG: Two-component sensor histidine kinase [Candidatus Saccharibacteria bacterium]|nr:Two-component sensor histidine kinase [Candidatus Saccharibacteria bacterium]
MYHRTVTRLAFQYSLLILAVLAVFSVGLYWWVDNLFDTQYVQEVESRLGSNDDLAVTAQQHKTVAAAAEVAVEQFRSVLLTADVAALIVIPFASYAIAKRSLRPLVAANESQKRFISNASHELRTPLAVMSGEFELALKRERDNDYYKKTIISTKEELERLNRMTNQLLELQRIENNMSKTTLGTKAVHVNELLTESISNSAKIAKNAGHTLEFRPDVDNDYIVVNASLIQTALDNLISNALKYSKSKSIVIIGVEVKNKAIVVFVENQPKVKMSESEEEHVFERFFQPKDEQGKNGFGLGLAIVKAIMDAHRGLVSVETNADRIRFSLHFK